MNYRSDLIHPAQASAAASGTLTLDIKTTKPISRIEMTYKTTKVLDGMTAAGPANIPKIELVDGSKPLHSLCGYTNQALAYYNRPSVSMEHGQHIPTLSEVDIYAIDFGRFLWDPLLAFDPTRFNNPQLKVSWNRALADTSVSVDSMEIWAELFDEKVPAPIGFLSAREIWNGNFLADNSVNEVMLPEDEVIRQILVRANEATYEPWHQIDIAKLDEASGGAVIFDYPDLEMYYRRMKSRWPMMHTPFFVGVTTSARIFYIPETDFWASLSLMGVGATQEVYESTASMAGGYCSLIGSGDHQCIGEARGYLPWHTFQFPMGKQDDPSDWYDPSGKKPRLRLTSAAGGVSGDGNVVIETVHKY
jgi:hypothetical protein